MDINQSFNFRWSLFKRIYSKFENILMDSLSVIKMLKNKIFDRDCFYFYNVLQEFVYQHFSKKRNNKIKTVFQTFIIIIMELMN